MISALAEAGAVLEREDYVEAAVRLRRFVLGELRDADGRLLRTWKDGRGRLGAYLEDHAFLLEALITLYETTFEPRWYHEAVALADTIIERFSDPRARWLLHHPRRPRASSARRKDLEDTPIPSGNSAAALRAAATGAALRRGQVRAPRPRRTAPAVTRLPSATRTPSAISSTARTSISRRCARWRSSARGHLRGSRARRPRRLPAPPRARRRPGDGRVPLLRDRGPVDGRAAAYVCEHFVCQAPVTEPEALAAAL